MVVLLAGAPAVVPAVVLPAVPAVVLLLGSSIRALFSTNRPSAFFARHPVTVTSCVGALRMVFD
jgi:hypothetical protein